jgi:hypothetical protein
MAFYINSFSARALSPLTVGQFDWKNDKIDSKIVN